jgi:hypothetical protein
MTRGTNARCRRRHPKAWRASAFTKCDNRLMKQRCDARYGAAALLGGRVERTLTIARKDGFELLGLGTDLLSGTPKKTLQRSPLVTWPRWESL